MHLSMPFLTYYLLYGALNPFLPILLRNLGYTSSVVGVLLAVFEGAGMAGPFVFGFLADKWGQYKPWLIVCYGIIIISLLPLAFSSHPLISALFLIVLGFGFRASMSLLDTMATINPANSGYYGKVRPLGSVGFIVMVLFLQWGKVLRPDNPLNISLWGSITAAASILAICFLPGKYTVCIRGSAAKTGMAQYRKFLSPLFLSGLVIIFLNRLAMSSVSSFLALYVVEALRWNAVGLIWAIATTAEIPLMFVSGSLIRRFGALRLLAFSTAMVGLRLAVYVLFPVKGGIIAGQLLHAVCFGLFHPSAIAFISKTVPPECRAFGMSLYLLTGTGLPNLTGSVIGGFLVDHLGYRPMFTFFIMFPVMAVSFYLFISRFKPKALT
jgi:PPP family 3-phenylpropionic acid transporter